MEKQTNYFIELNAINVSDKIEKKNGLSYLSWAWAWQQIKSVYPNAQVKVYETPEGCIYWHDMMTAWVKVGVTVNDIEHIEYLPVMDYKNKSIPMGSITSMNVNTAIQRATVKAIARHGLGLYIYAGEDLPEEDKKAPNGALKALDGSPQDAGFKNAAEMKVVYKEKLEKLKSINDLHTFNKQEIAINDFIERLAAVDAIWAESFRNEVEMKEKQLKGE